MKNIKFIYIGLIASISLIGCDEDDRSFGGLPGERIGVDNVSLSESTISVFDVSKEVNVDFEVQENVAIQSATLTVPERSLTSNLSDNSATFNTSLLLPFTFGEDNDETTGSFTINVAYATETDDLQKAPDLTLNVVDAISIIETPESVISNDTTITQVIYKTFTAGAVIDAIDVTWQLNSDGDENDLQGEFAIEGDTLAINNDLYYDQFNAVIGDTIIVNFTAQSGALLNMASVRIPLLPQTFQTPIVSSISNKTSNQQVDLSTGTNFDVGSNEGDIVFVTPNSFSAVEGSDIEFVALPVPNDVTSTMFFSNFTNLEAAINAFENGTTLAISSVSAGDVFVYKVTRTIAIDEDTSVDREFYGLLLVDRFSVTQEADVEGDITSIFVTSKENSLIIEE